MKGQRPMKSNIKNILRGVGVERASPEDPTAVKLTNFIEKELTKEEKLQLELKAIAEKAKKLKEIEEEEERLEEKRKHLEKVYSVQNKIEKPFSLGREIDTTSMREAAVDSVLPKSFIPEPSPAYPEPFKEEPALNKELHDFKTKINTHLSKLGFASGTGGGAGFVKDLSDVDISGRTHKSILMFNDVTGKYEKADPDLDAGIANEDDSGDEITLNGTTSSGSDEGGAIQQEDQTRTSVKDTTVSSMSFSTPTITLTDSSSSTVTVDLPFPTTLGLSEASKAVTVDSSGDLIIPDSDKFEFGGGSDMTLYHDGSNSYITNKTGALKIATETSGIAITIGHGTSETTIADNLVVTGTATAGGNLLSQVGTQTIWVPAAAMRPTSSNGCAAITDVETTAGRPDLQVLDFDTSSDEHAQFGIGFPKSWNEGTVTFRVFWTSTATDTDGVAWGLQGVSVANDATIDVAYGTAVVVTDDNISAAEDCLVTATSGAVTIASAAVDTLTFFRIFRDVSDANDDMAEDARLIGVQIFFTTDAVNDA